MDATPERTVRKVAWRLVPFLMCLYFVAYIDRVNIGFAGLTMTADVGLSDAAFGLGAGIFFLGYFLFEVPSNLILHRVGARRWLARIMVTWGIASAAMAFVEGPISFYVLRFLLGVAEAGFFPGVILYLSYWIPAPQRAGLTATFMAAVPLSTALGAPLSGALLMLDGWLGMKGWQWLFLIEALPAVVLGVVTWFALTDRPEQARWLAPEERDWLAATLRAEQRAAGRAPETLAGSLRALLDGRVLALGLVYFGTSAGLYTLGIWAPKFIAQFGVAPLANGFINAVPALLAVAGMIAWSRHSDRRRERPVHVALACVLAASGLVLAATAQSLGIAVLALVLANVGISAAKPPLWSLPTTFLAGPAAAAGIGAINAIGNLGGFVGPAAIGWTREASGGFAAGLLLVATLLVASALLVLRMRRRESSPLLEEELLR